MGYSMGAGTSISILVGVFSVGWSETTPSGSGKAVRASIGAGSTVLLAASGKMAGFDGWLTSRFVGKPSVLSVGFVGFSWAIFCGTAAGVAIVPDSLSYLQRRDHAKAAQAAITISKIRVNVAVINLFACEVSKLFLN